jgi:hypothetical protein
MLRRTAVLLMFFASWLPAQNPSFNAASVIPNSSGAGGGSMGVRAQRFVAINVSLSALLAFAFTLQGGRLRQEQIIGLPPGQC